MSIKCLINKKLTAEKFNLAKFLKIISDDNRLRILNLLKGGERCVCKIYPNLDLSQNLVSSHLKIMLNFGLLNIRREGKKNFYSLNSTMFKKYNLSLTNFLKNYE
jgi:ArsR family transcriptional regulator